LSEKIHFRIDHENVILEFPQSVGSIEGSLVFYAPSNEADDYRLPVHPDRDYRQIISIKNLHRGFWKLQIDWSANRQSYYFENSFMIN
jgi:hypothetical protein